MAYSYSGEATVNIKNRDELFEAILDNMENLRKSDIPNARLDELEKNCKSKNFNVVAESLKKLALDFSSNVIVSYLMAMLSRFM